MQEGLNTQAKLNGATLPYYLQLVRSIKQEFPQIHIHAFSPQEVQFIAREDDISYEKVIDSLGEAGVGSMPGTAAEVLDDEVRKIICPEKINAATWVEIVSTAHRLAPAINQCRAPKPLRRRVGRDQPILEEVFLLTAVARILLGNWIVNHQPSWVKIGLNGAKEAFKWGCNNIGGTLMEEHITTMAGAQGGTYMEPATLQQAISDLGRSYRERNTLYSSRHIS